MIEVGRSVRSQRRLRGKDDPLDALRAARSALASESLTLQRAGERHEALRVLLLARRSAVGVRRIALVQLRSVIVTAPEGLRAELRRLPTGQLIRRCSRFRRSSSRTPDELAIVLTLRSLARRIEAATEEANELEREIVGHVHALVPQLLAESGVGPIVAAQLIVTWSHRGRILHRSSRFDTGLTHAATAEERRRFVASMPMGRMGRPEELAELVSWLASERCSFSTGASFDLSTGRAVY